MILKSRWFAFILLLLILFLILALFLLYLVSVLCYYLFSGLLYLLALVALGTLIAWISVFVFIQLRGCRKLVLENLNPQACVFPLLAIGQLDHRQ